MSIYQQPPLEGPRQLGSPWGPEREKKKWSSRFNKRKLLIGVGVYLLLNLAYFLLTTTSPYSLVPWLGQVVWILFCLFCLGVWLFLLIGVGLLLIKLVRKEPKRKGLYSLLGVLAYVFFALGMFYALFLFSLVALFSSAFNSSWNKYEEKGEIYYEQRVWKESDRCLTMRQENLIFAYSLDTGYCHRETETYYLPAPEQETASPVN